MTELLDLPLPTQHALPATTCKLKGVASVQDLRERLKKPLLLELQTGCRDSAVVGGIERLVTTVGKPFADVRAVVAGYGELDEAGRKERLEQAIKLLSVEPEKVKKVRSAKVEDVPQPQQVTRNSEVEASVLEDKLEDRTLDIGAQAPKKLAALGIQTYRDLLYTYPKRYEDRRALPHFGGLTDGDSVTVVGTVTGRKAVRSKRGMVVLRAFLEDAHGGRLTAVWFNQGWLEKQLFPGQRLIVTGKVKRRGRLAEVNVSHHEIDEEGESLSAGRIVGIYPTTQGLSQAYVRRAAYKLLENLPTLPDHLPKSVLERFSLVSFDNAMREIHFPSEEKALQGAVRRLKFDEFLFLELRIMLNRDTTLLGKSFKVRERDLKTFAKSLPFELTGAQDRALREILDDMREPKQMARLLQGDVGSGKTAVAAAAAYIAAKNGYQVALMAPTENLGAAALS